LPWALRTRILETAIIDSTGVFWMEFLRRRREFIALLGGAAATWPLAARAQQPDQVRRIGVLMGAANDSEGQARARTFEQGLNRLGWMIGRNLRINYRWGARDNPQQARSYAAELIALAPNVVVTQGSQNSEALLKETRNIPIIFVEASDPMSSGLVSSMAHPAGNLTGFTNFEFSIGSKWLEILKEVALDIKRVLVLQGLDIGNQGFLRSIQASAPSLGVVPVAAPVRDAADIERAITAFVNEPQGGLIVLPGSSRMDNRDLIVAMAARHHLPAMYSSRAFIASGGLMSYDTDLVDLWRQAASYVDRILRGEKAGDLPVQIPTKYELVINLKLARALGLTVPLPLLARADEVIE
jgi:putative ABC transport system substrate-binding protein